MADIPQELRTHSSPDVDPLPDFPGRLTCSCGSTIRLAKTAGHGVRVLHKACQRCVEKEERKAQADAAMAALQDAIDSEAAVRVRVQPWLYGTVAGLRLHGGEEITEGKPGLLRIRRPAGDETIVELATPGGDWLALEIADLWDVFTRLGFGEGGDHGSGQ